MIDKGIFGNSSDAEDRLKTLEGAREISEGAKKIGVMVVLTNGTFDTPHWGHVKYLAKARSYGDLLFVGVDSDEKVRSRKGEHRPVVPQDERLAILASLRCVDALVLKELNHEKWALIKAVCPDVLVVSETTRKNKPIPQEEIDELGKYCGRIIILPAQAETSTTARIAKLQLDFGRKLTSAITQAIPDIVHRMVEGNEGGKK